MTASGRGSRARSDDALGGGATIRGAALVAVAALVGAALLAWGFKNGVLPTDSETPSEQAGTNNGNDEGDGGEGEESTTTSTTAVAHAPAEVRAIVLNGGGPGGSAGTASTALATAQYTTLDAANTDDVPASVIYYVEGFQADAIAIGQVLTITAAPQPMPATPPTGVPAGQVDVVVVLGPDFTPAG